MTDARKIELHDAFVFHILEAINNPEDLRLIFENLGMTPAEISEIMED